MDSAIRGIRPDRDATVLRYGSRRLLFALPIVVVLVGMGGVGGWLAYAKPDGAAAWVCTSLLLFTGVVGVFFFGSRWRDRHWTTVFDASGFWWMGGEEAALIRWDSLAGAGIYWARGDRSAVFTIELCPKDEIDRDDPLLWKFVRDTDPLRPDLPRLRYRIDVSDSHKMYEKALLQWAPELWFGRKEQPLSYPGEPDHEGHRERTDGQAGEAGRGVGQPLVFDSVEIGNSVLVHDSGVLIRRRLVVASVMVAICAWAVWALGGGHGTSGVVSEVIAAVLVLLSGWALVLIIRGVYGIWNRRVTMNAAGIRVTQRGRSKTVRWDSLAGVGVWASSSLHTLELCPKDEIDCDDPMLWGFVRDDEPLRPDLPRLRYRISLWPAVARHTAAAGCQRWAPELWFDGQRRPTGYEGTADVKGHRRRARIRRRGGTVTPAP